MVRDRKTFFFLIPTGPCVRQKGGGNHGDYADRSEDRYVKNRSGTRGLLFPNLCSINYWSRKLRMANEPL